MKYIAYHIINNRPKIVKADDCLYKVAENTTYWIETRNVHYVNCSVKRLKERRICVAV